MPRPRDEKPAFGYFWFSDWEGGDKVQRFRMALKQAGFSQMAADGFWLAIYRKSIHSPTPGVARGPTGRVASIQDWAVWFDQDEIISAQVLNLAAECGVIKKRGKAGHYFPNPAKSLSSKHRSKFLSDSETSLKPSPEGGVLDILTGRDGTERDGTELGSGEGTGEGEGLSCEQIKDAWNVMAGVNDLPTVIRLTDKRRTAIKARLKEDGWADGYEQSLAKVAASPFCLGTVGRGWRANFDWFLRPDTVMKLLEGQHDDRAGRTGQGAQRPRVPDPGVYDEGAISV